MVVRSEAKIKKLKTIEASYEKPYLVCRTCGIATDKVIKRFADSLRHIPHNTPHRFKSWKRTVKYDKLHKTHYRNRECRQKVIYFSYFMLNCIKAKHKLMVRKAPFSARLISSII